MGTKPIREGGQGILPGKREWFDSMGLNHRTDGPAVEVDNGAKAWCEHGEFIHSEVTKRDGTIVRSRWYGTARVTAKKGNPYA